MPYESNTDKGKSQHRTQPPRLPPIPMHAFPSGGRWSYGTRRFGKGDALASPAMVRRSQSANNIASSENSSPPPSSQSTDSRAPFMALLTQLKPGVEERLEKLFESSYRGDGARGQEVTRMLEAARALTMRGGKRLRAGLVAAGQIAIDGKRSQKALVTACGAAIELIQSYFLIHDDWMDQDATRRGGPSVHAALAERFESSHLGACGAILAGDYLMTLGTEHLLKSCKNHPRSNDLAVRFCELQRAAVVGQQLDVISQTKDAELVYQLKTSSYTVSGPLALGALLADASKAQLKALDRFGLSAGIAFQLRDDLLSLFGDPSQTGKPLGNDLLAGKWTWTVQYALQHGDKQDQAAIESVLGHHKSSKRKLANAFEALERSGARRATEEQILRHRKRAEQTLAKAPLHDRGKALLHSAASTLIDRNA